VEKPFFCRLPAEIYEILGRLYVKRYFRAYIIEHLKTKCSAEEDTVVIYYFFDSSEKRSLKASAFLRCILHQTIRPEVLLPDSQRHLESVFLNRIGQSEPITIELEELFLHSYSKFKRSLLLVDGLDEVDEIEQRNVKSILKEVQKMEGARILMTTHAAMNMSKVLSNGLSWYIRPDDLKDDIKTFVHSQIDKYSQEELSDCNPHILDITKQKLTSDAEGM
jgi:hypothetical protein